MIGLLPPAHMDDSHLLHIHGSCEAYGYENFGLLVGFLFIGLLLVGLFLPNLALGSRRSPILTTSANLPVFPVRSHNFMTNYIHTLFISYSLYASYQILWSFLGFIDFNFINACNMEENRDGHNKDHHPSLSHIEFNLHPKNEIEKRNEIGEFENFCLS